MSATTPGPEQAQRPPGGMGYGGYLGCGARMPMPGNAEFVFFVIAMLLLAIIALASDVFNIPDWVDVFKWLGAAYLLSRGIAKASRVLEQ